MKSVHLIILSLILLISGCTSITDLSFDKPPNGWGKIEGKIKTQWKRYGREMILLEDASYTSPNGTIWPAPKGHSIDGATIPKFLWSVIGGPYESEYRWASVFHDVGCDQRARSWQEVHYMFYTAMRAAGVKNKKAKLMYAGVYKYGPRWKNLTKHTSIPIAAPIPSKDSIMEIEKMSQIK